MSDQYSDPPQPAGQWAPDPTSATPYNPPPPPTQQFSAPGGPTGPVPIIPPPPPLAPPVVGRSANKKSPLLAILLALAVIATGAFAFLWHKASNDTDTAKKATVAAQTAADTAAKKSAKDLADAKQAAADAAAKAKADLDAANAKATADAAAAAAKAQTDAQTALDKAKADDASAAAALQAKLDTANAVVAATQAQTATCKKLGGAVSGITDSINTLIQLINAERAADTATVQQIVANFDNVAFNAQKDALNAALAACIAA